MTNKLAVYSTNVVLAHFIVQAFHGIAHSKLRISLSPAQTLFVIAVITIAPILAAILLWTKLRRFGAWLLLVSMAASLVFGVYYHFIFLSPDNALHMAAGAWQRTFQITSVLLVLTEAWGCWAGLRGLR